MLLDREVSHLLIIDVQEKLAPAIAGGEVVVGNVQRLIAYAGRLGVPVTATEQYPEGLGPTRADVRQAVSDAGGVTLSKLAFSAWKEAECRSRIEQVGAQGRGQVVIAGMESHVCVLQAALDIKAAGFDVAVVADAVGSRVAGNYDRAIERLRRGKVEIVTQEMVAFEWLGRAGTPEFKDVLSVLK